MKRFVWITLVAVAGGVASILTHASATQTTLPPTAARPDRARKRQGKVGRPSIRVHERGWQSRLCDCLNGDLRIEVDFQKYITVTTAVGTKIGQLSPDDQRIAPCILSTRDRCVAQVFDAPSR